LGRHLVSQICCRSTKHGSSPKPKEHCYRLSNTNPLSITLIGFHHFTHTNGYSNAQTYLDIHANTHNDHDAQKPNIHANSNLQPFTYGYIHGSLFINANSIAFANMD
jgi:hypothetical protein